MTIKKKLILLFAIPLAALAITALLGFRAQNVQAEVVEDAVSSATITRALDELALAAGAERLPADGATAAETEASIARTDAAGEALVGAERFTQIDVDSAGKVDMVAQARNGNPGQWQELLSALADDVDAQPVESYDATGVTAALSSRAAVRGMLWQEQAWFDVLAVEAGETAPTLAADFARAETLLNNAASRPFDAADSYGAALTSPAQLRLNELRALAVEDVMVGTTADLDPQEVFMQLAESRAAWSAGVTAANATVIEALVERNAEIVDGRSLYLLLAGVSGVLLAALLFVVGRSILRPLNGLIEEADMVANVRLPKVVNHLRSLGASDEIPPMPPIARQSNDEVGALVDAFNEVQGTAVQLATEQAQSRRNVAEMFVNLGRRNQQLNHRMLSMLSDLERNEQDAEALAGLYQLDHLATRMRRNAESLLVLAGNQTPRQWSKPVSVERAVRAALGEIEGYERVDVLELPDAAVLGSVVADVTHLLAELLENATNFSDPSTRVEIGGYRMREGLVFKIIDHGIGMGASDLDEHNARIATAPRLDEAPSRLLGLFVVGRLADRHGLRVVLESAPNEGTTVQIMVPGELVIVADDESVEATGVSASAAIVTPPPTPTVPSPDVAVVHAPPLVPDVPKPVLLPPPVVVAEVVAPPPLPGAPAPLGGLPTRAPQQAFAEAMPVQEPLVSLASNAVATRPADTGAGSGFGSLVAFVGGVNRGLDELQPEEGNAQ